MQQELAHRLTGVTDRLGNTLSNAYDNGARVATVTDRLGQTTVIWKDIDQISPDLVRAVIAAEQAVASPLLEDVNLANARGVLVNITASSSFKMKEYYDLDTGAHYV